MQPGPDARTELATSLLESLDGEVDEHAEEEWRTTIQRRLAELDSGAVRTIGWPEVRARLPHHIRQ